MKSFNIFLVFLLLFLHCKPSEKEANTPKEPQINQEYDVVGIEINAEDASTASEMFAIYNNLVSTDTLVTKFSAKVTEVCQAKGCWMKVQLNDGQQAMVRFKDYGFFVPKDIADRKVVLSGKAFIEEMSVEDQQHYAKDEGKTAEEIAAITKEKRTYGFEAEGVMIFK